MTLGNGNTRFMVTIIAGMAIVGVGGVVILAIFGPPKDTVILIAAIFGFLVTIATGLFTLVKTQESLDQSKTNREELGAQSHDHKIALALQSQEIKEIVTETKDVVVEAAKHVDERADQKELREERKEEREEKKDKRDERREIREEKKADEAVKEP